jgi:phenylalanyl-tRNA synthetase beta chain
MGTHNLDKIKGPIVYQALPPTEIQFQALKQKDSMNAVDLFNVFRTDNVMKKFLPIIEDFERYPVFHDASG